jgi:hypothetical protein
MVPDSHMGIGKGRATPGAPNRPDISHRSTAVGCVPLKHFAHFHAAAAPFARAAHGQRRALTN